MCVGIPMQILSCDGIAATAREAAPDETENPAPSGKTELIDLSLTGPLEPGTWVLTFLGAAREVISADEADKIAKALGGLRALMDGGELGNAFADLEAGGPTLPPHLQAAMDAGKPVA